MGLADVVHWAYAGVLPNPAELIYRLKWDSKGIKSGTVLGLNVDITFLCCKAMRMVATHTSALEITRICGASFINSRQRLKDPKRIIRAVPAISPIEIAEHPILRNLPRPVCVLNNSSSHFGSSPELKHHQWSSTSFDLIDLGGGLYIPDPETLFLQLADQLSVYQLACLAFELCGIYESGRMDASTAIDRLEPLTSAFKIERAVLSSKRIRGIAKARKILPYITDRSASPMETATYLRLTLPYQMGGFNLPKPLMNCRVDLGSGVKQVSSSQYCVPDLIWPEHRLIVEYDSDLHASPLKIGRDAARKNTMTAMGFDVITITKMQMYNMDEFNKTALVVGRKLGVRHNPRCKDYRQRQADLVRELLLS